MPSLKDIKRRINSIKSTRQTTRAMKMVAAAKLKRSQEAILNSRPYAKQIDDVVGKIAATQKIDSKYFPKAETSNKEILVVVSSDRGLCGGFNANVSKMALKYLNENSTKKEIYLICVGKKAADYLKRRGYEPKQRILNLVNEISYEYAQKFFQGIEEKYFKESYDSIQFLFNQFHSAISQESVKQTLLPIQPKTELWEEKAKTFSKEYIFEPEPQIIVDQLLTKSVNVQVYKAFLESLASEHGARMNAMENATKNAGELISKLTLTYNNLRQAAITTELIEITSGAEALN